MELVPSEGLREWVKLASDGAVGLGAVAGAIIAAVALQTWRAQLHGASQHERAKATLDAAYVVRDAIRHSRDLFEGPALEHYWACYLRIQTAVDDLDGTLLRARVYWPTELEDCRRGLGAIVGRYYRGVARLRQMEDKTLDPLKMSDEQAREQAMALYGLAQDSDHDELLADANASVREFERVLGKAAGAPAGRQRANRAPKQ